MSYVGIHFVKIIGDVCNTLHIDRKKWWNIDG